MLLTSSFLSTALEVSLIFIDLSFQVQSSISFVLITKTIKPQSLLEILYSISSFNLYALRMESLLKLTFTSD
ncbi:hypothetical protein QES_4120 [Clostridioides difficile CD149]|nr:hypothetical protein QAW_1071 [Clostridioides difficile CD17]EQE71527.1 hypothetical protein QCK_4138 [Clostridioides difficile CD45]EQE71988.1 hypothetical protein QCQ_3995 [Clostridioides difficile CD49]EQF21933.1 hypothetical protein QES_4120 [Clostridioides difficile CD149]EQG33599.1 hypothetical protein QIM_2941 [Clostridioides difficile DA00128]EQG38231.1 hypothetical protein QIO_0429 [Clostridioides difficile DA00129]EQJ06243.1 hypothetical protein QQW_4084 [Clostridioides difficile